MTRCDSPPTPELPKEMLAGIGAGFRHQRGPVAPARLAPHHQAGEIAGQRQDVGEVVHRIPGGGARHEGVRQDAGMDLADRIAIRLGLAVQHLRGEGAARAGTVLHQDWLAQLPPRDLRQHAHLAVGGAARSPGHDQPDRPVGKPAAWPSDGAASIAAAIGASRRRVGCMAYPPAAALPAAIGRQARSDGRRSSMAEPPCRAALDDFGLRSSRYRP